MKNGTRTTLTFILKISKIVKSCRQILREPANETIITRTCDTLHGGSDGNLTTSADEKYRKRSQMQNNNQQTNRVFDLFEKL